MKNKNEIMKTLNKFKKSIESEGYNVYAIMLKGSQNYNLDDCNSDIDANAILLPTLTQLCSGKNISKKFTFEEGEVTAHDIVSFTKIVEKGNPQWVEVCHTEYKIGCSLEPWQHIKVNPSALKGMVYEKVKAFDKLYPSRKHMIEEFGYDPKQLHHIIRLKDLLVSGDNVIKYSGDKRSELINIKRGSLAKSEAIKLMNYNCDIINKIYDKAKKEYVQQHVSNSVIEEILRSEIKKSINTVNVGNNVYRTITTLRTFESALPKHVRKAFEEDIIKNIDGKDCNVNMYYEIEVL